MSSDWRRTAAASSETGYREAVYPLYQPVETLRQEIEAPSNLGEPLIGLAGLFFCRQAPQLSAPFRVRLNQLHKL